MKRAASSEVEALDAVKRQKPYETVPTPLTLERAVSPPGIAKNGFKPGPKAFCCRSWEALVDNHFSLFSSKLFEASRSIVPATPRDSH